MSREIEEIYSRLLARDYALISLQRRPRHLGKSIFEYRPESHGAEDYLALYREIIERG